MKQVIKDASLFTVPKSDVRGEEVVLWRLRQKTKSLHALVVAGIDIRAGLAARREF